MQIHKEKRKKEILLSLCESAGKDLFLATMQDCHGMADTISRKRDYESFLTEWLGEVQGNINSLNSEPSDTFLTGNYDAIKKASR